ncbi:hypothetical protein HBN50_13975 [Halobacteriovorax sp. GB3]|uniref:hypothetical protein n=1 Tax=Halobacteriovorax sp. GB3 TaxID=2719615 RepID=UPI00235EFAFD|nr:hypothetical protein [Halobacteriovorax sp. GB3]MDD0854216.1 hypothetical protein [Halobacteriovorax sp. GB3]
MAEKKRRKRRVKKPVVDWERVTLMHHTDFKTYKMKEEFEKGDYLVHASFGRGFVEESNQKNIEVLFEDKKRILMHRYAA